MILEVTNQPRLDYQPLIQEMSPDPRERGKLSLQSIRANTSLFEGKLKSEGKMRRGRQPSFSPLILFLILKKNNIMILGVTN